MILWNCFVYAEDINYIYTQTVPMQTLATSVPSILEWIQLTESIWYHPLASNWKWSNGGGGKD